MGKSIILLQGSKEQSNEHISLWLQKNEELMYVIYGQRGNLSKEEGRRERVSENQEEK